MGCKNSKSTTAVSASPAAVAAPAKTLLNSRAFSSAEAKGGKEMQPATTAVIFIEYQNEFTSEGGKLHGAVKEVMEASGMLDKSAAVAKAIRRAGGKVFHVPISFAKDGSDNPNKGLGILAGCAKDELFTSGTWNAEICDAMKPEEGDIIVAGKKGLDAFPGTDLEAQLKAHSIETVLLAGFLTNCCVESTMRTACEKGFNVITLTDCTATTSKEGHKAATDGTFGMFSTPMTSGDMITKLEAQPVATPGPAKPVEGILLGNTRCYSAADAKGGAAIQPGKTAVLFIEYQNEFTSEGGKLHSGVKEVMAESGMLGKSADVAKAVRASGGKVFHAPISFAKDGSDNPNKGLGILAGCAKDELFTSGTWNVEFCEAMKPQEGDIVVAGKKGLDAFPGTDLEAQLTAHGIETLALAGFLTNCCVESTMRTACEKGFNVVTLTDCTATTSKEGQKAATEGTFGMFSQPMNSAAFLEKLAPGALEGNVQPKKDQEVAPETRNKDEAVSEIKLEGALEGTLAEKACWCSCR
jgi:nicotinamidase-related amidase